jgi:hypothetical protein
MKLNFFFINHLLLFLLDDENETEENNLPTSNLDKENEDNSNIILEGNYGFEGIPYFFLILNQIWIQHSFTLKK